MLVLASACGRFGFHGQPSQDSGSLGDDDAPGDGVGGDGPIVCPAGLGVCDGFEGTQLASIWMADPMVALDTTRAHRGTSSVHVHSPAFAANAGSYQALFASASVAPSTTFYLRGWFWLSSLPAANNGLELLTAEHPGSSTGDYVFVQDFRTTVYTQLDSMSDETPTTVPTGQWFCLIWKVVKDTGSAGSLSLTGDVAGINLSEPLAQTDSTSFPITMITLGLGFAATNTPSNQPALDLWIDDVIIDANALTCQE